MPTIALSMIARNASSDIERCLNSAAPVVDQIIVADTGSTDRTAELARACGAEVISIPWENDFARARNLALAPVRTDWVLVLDADEMLDTEPERCLPKLISNPDVYGYQVMIRNYVRKLKYRLWDRVAKPNDSTIEEARKFPAYLEHENVRLFRRDPDIYFVGRVHETVGWKIESTGRKVGTATFLIHHFGMIASEEETRRKNFFYRELGRQKVAEMPGNAEAHLELGLLELDAFQNESGALACFEKACELKPRLGIAWFFAGVTSYRLGDFARALRSFQESERCGHITGWTKEFLGDTHYNLGDFRTACQFYELATLRVPDSNDVKSKLGLAEVRMGNPTSGMKRMREAIQQEPSNAQLYDRFIQAAVWTGLLADAADIAERKLETASVQPQDFVRAASIRARCNDWARSSEIARAGLARFSKSELLRRVLSEIEQQQKLASIS